MNKLKIILIASIVGIIILLFIFLMFLTNLQPNTKRQPPVSVTPTAIPLSEDELFIVSILPTDRNAVYTPAQPLQITFTQEVPPQNLKYTTLPQTQILIVKGEKPKTLIFAPRTFWQNGNTTITFLDSTQSNMGNVLKNPQTYTLKTAIPTIPEGLEGGY